MDRYMEMQYRDFDLRESMTCLQGLGICLKIAVLKLPSSMIKQYLFVTTKPIEIRSIDDFYLLQNRITDMVYVTFREKLGEENGGKEVLSLLREIKSDVERMVGYIKKYGL